MNPGAPTTVRDSVASRADEMLDLLVQLVRIPTVSGDEGLAVQAFEDWFHCRGWQVDRQVLAETAMATTTRGRAEPRLGERANLIGWLGRPTGRPVVTLNAHYDVVPIIDIGDWTDEPFSGARRDGRIFGRGAVDNKGGCVTALYAMQALADVGAELPFDVAVELVAGEETTGLGTVASLELPFERLATVVLEPTANAVVPVNSGAIFFTVEVDGVAVHTSMPWRGHDAVHKLIDVYNGLRALGDRRSESHRHPLMEHLPSSVPLVIGAFSGGGWRAALPAHARMSGRIGILPGESAERVKQIMLDEIARVSAADPWLAAHPPRVTWDNDGLSGWELDLEHPLVAALTEGQKAAGAAVAIEGITTGCDAGTLRRAGVPVVVFGPGDLARAHSPNEYVLDAEVTTATETLAGALSALARDGRLDEGR